MPCTRPGRCLSTWRYRCVVEPAISIAQLRQNPTAMIRAVKAGLTYTLTDCGQPIASISPLRRPVWRSATAVNELLRGLGPDPA